MISPHVVDICAGSGGWEEGFRLAGFNDTSNVWGYEINPIANKTARAAGHRRIEADVSQVKPQHLVPATGHVGSPPCGSFSTAGLQKGVKDAVALVSAARVVRSLAQIDSAILTLHSTMTDERSILALEPLRWALAQRPEWLAWEQVPTVQPIWDACAMTLRALGYSVNTGVLTSEQYEVPQTRRRAVLVASRTHDVKLPRPVRAAYRVNRPTYVDTSLPRPESIMDVIYDSPSLYMAGAGATSRKSAGQIPRAITYPAHTVTGVGSAAWVHVEDGEVTHERQATVRELGLIQSFPADYPWAGNSGQRHQQVGDAIPPLLAAHIIRAAMGEQA